MYRPYVKICVMKSRCMKLQLILKVRIFYPHKATNMEKNVMQHHLIKDTVIM